MTKNADSDREWLAPEALGVLDRCSARGEDVDNEDVIPHLMRRANAIKAWHTAGRPLLSPRARAIKEAVEKAMTECGTCQELNDCSRCAIVESWRNIRRAYLSGEAKPPCPKCGGTKRAGGESNNDE